MKLDCPLPPKTELKQKQPYEYINSHARGENVTKKCRKRRQDTRHRTHILNRHWQNGDRRWRRTALRSPFLTRNIGELPVSRSSFPLLLEDSDEITVWILWLDLLFSTVCAKGRLDQMERGSVTTGGAVDRKQFVCGSACDTEAQM
jgi:hypothetical protein